METGPSSSEKTSDQLSWVPEEQPPSSQARTYDCTFCKRGFSNAQALGGHMNLHRKDRAKLKQPSNDNHLAFDEEIPSRVSFVSPISANSVLEAERRDKRRSLPWLLPRRCEDQSFFKEEDLHEVGPRQLRLFDDTPPTPVDVLSIDQQGAITERRMQFEVPHERAVMEVDLELRLGPEP